jgi:hypothetical protein
MRYTVRQGTTGWLVWDHQTDAVAIMGRTYALNLSEEAANYYAHDLNRREAIRSVSRRAS